MRKAILLFGGTIASILVIALVSIMLFGRTRMAAFAITIGAAHVIVLGVPVFLILHRRNLIRWWTSMIAGYLCGAIPTAFVMRRLIIGGSGSYSSRGSGQDTVITMVDGIATPAGFIDYIMAFSFMGAFGAVAALGFWFVWSRATAS